jgi:imidazolonepropionase-like amidohydrolase
MRPFSPVDGKVTPELAQVIAIAARNNLVLETGHSSGSEDLIIIEEAKRQGVQNVMVTHALTNPGGPLTLSEIQQATKLGAYIELVYGGLSEDLLRRDAEVIRAVGASSVVLSTDLGQPNNPLHTDGLLAFYKGLMAHGISEADIVQMSQTNPAKLLGLKP